MMRWDYELEVEERQSSTVSGMPWTGLDLGTRKKTKTIVQPPHGNGALCHVLEFDSHSA